MGNGNKGRLLVIVQSVVHFDEGLKNYGENYWSLQEAFNQKQKPGLEILQPCHNNHISLWTPSSWSTKRPYIQEKLSPKSNFYFSKCCFCYEPVGVDRTPCRHRCLNTLPYHHNTQVLIVGGATCHKTKKQTLRDRTLHQRVAILRCVTLYCCGIALTSHSSRR